ncbi:MAG: HU family DNA-binding protein [Bacteroidota bacterium]|nr:HU family DNA-binding protein [Bacteroidota bacterium]
MIKIKINQKVNPQDIEGERKFYGVTVSSGALTVRQLAKQISKETTIGTPDVMAVIEAFLQDIPEYLLEGKIINLRDFGSFRLTVSGEGSATAEEYNTNLISKTNLHFRPSREFKDSLKSAVFHKIPVNN